MADNKNGQEFDDFAMKNLLISCRSENNPHSFDSE
tara:strand:- start:9719 stop:9823 length:105 start_codon:yes stop_codon:yes gene_type:complete